ncbi:alpha/beta fold hydrolase [Adhaeribacter radiodurans]|uniref:Esterase n=1 Tax=Adhaeribacter radiodurans TaxID=2745197 RepID=A0A7L7LAL6_9BACT|nr:alpha/beta fold hydrolase [Adhaeribacter radiodurans]QMU29878.1 esterase [Adhaeribacter radiodurans]
MNSQNYTVKNHEVEVIPFTASDGFLCNLINLKSAKVPDKGPVLLVHGAGVRASIFLAPVPQNIVEFLTEAGFDVWLENWRASIDFAPNPWTLDQAALYDHPAAVKKIVELTGAKTIKAIIHCQGSTSFMMAAVQGLLPEVSTIVSNAVSLHPVVPPFSRFKLGYMVPVVGGLTSYLNPQWGLHAPTLTAKMLNALVKLTHHECENQVCKQVSFTYGTGFPALWRHENLNEETHEWLKQEFAHVPLTFYKQMKQSVRAGHLLSAGETGEKSKKVISYVANQPATQARISFFAGEQNLCFLPSSQVKSYQYFNHLRRNFHKLRLIPRYSHLDIFMGKEAYRDVFPLMLQDLSN